MGSEQLDMIYIYIYIERERESYSPRVTMVECNAKPCLHWGFRASGFKPLRLWVLGL